MDDAATFDPEARYREILDRATADPDVARVVVFGSRGAGGHGAGIDTWQPHVDWLRGKARD